MAACLALALAAGAPASGHRLDEYLQAARIDLEPARVVVELGLTPGAAVAAGVVAGIDRDRDRLVSDDEARAYGRRILRDLHVTLDGRPFALAVVDHQVPVVESIFAGVGTIRFRLAAVMPLLQPGSHRLQFRNDHRPDISVYLANALVPASNRLEVLAQDRSVDQRNVAVIYRFRAARRAMVSLRDEPRAGVAGRLTGDRPAFLYGVHRDPRTPRPWRRNDTTGGSRMIVFNY